MALNYFMLLTLEELKTSPMWPANASQKGYYTDDLATQAIYISTTILDFISGHQISNDWDAQTITEINLNHLKIACERQTLFLLRNGVEYMRAAQMSISTGSFNYQQSNPSDQMYVVPEAIQELDRSGYLIKAEPFSLFGASRPSILRLPSQDSIIDFILEEGDKRFITVEDGLGSSDQSINIKQNSRQLPLGTQMDITINPNNIPKPDLTPYEKTVDHATDIEHINEKLETKEDLLTQIQLNNINMDHSVFGKVKTVNLKEPDEKGNIDIPGADNVYTKEESDDRFLSKKTPFDLVSDLDGTKTKIHADYKNLQFYNSAGNSEVFIGDDLRIVGDNNQVDLIHDPVTHSLTYERDDFTGAPDRTVANLGYVNKWNNFPTFEVSNSNIEWNIPSGVSCFWLTISLKQARITVSPQYFLSIVPDNSTMEFLTPVWTIDFDYKIISFQIDKTNQKVTFLPLPNNQEYRILIKYK